MNNSKFMKRKLCIARSLRICEDEDMEELNVSQLAVRKESVAPLTCDARTLEKASFLRRALGYPLALVLRLRVLQIVCGISAMVMGSVAFIEERRQFNMGLGIPAGGVTVLAAAVSIHTSRGWSGGPKSNIGGSVASVLWAGVGCLLVALIVQCCRTIVDPPGVDYGNNSMEISSRPSPSDLVVIAWVQMALALMTLVSAVACARIDCLGAS